MPAPFRLDKNIKPKKYYLHIEPDFSTLSFIGNVNIETTITGKSDTIFLHAKDLVINSAIVKQGNKIFNTQITSKQNDGYIILSLPQKISGEAEIIIDYNGAIHEDLRGFYIGKHNIGDTEYLIGATQFEAIDARRAFPCFDEPAIKASFNLQLLIDKQYSAISNTNIIKEKVSGKKKEITFAETPQMSSYLVAWAIGKFEKVSKKTNPPIGGKKDVSVYVPTGKKSGAGFALDVSVKVLDFFENYFGIPYPLQKLDLVALPDFASAAMENWGLITFRETALLVEKKHTALQNKKWVALVIAHEIAHQWFGNLVTMNWWDDLWLNEGFANYIEYVAIDAIFPEWNVWDEFVGGDMGDALRLDSLKSSHPIKMEIKDAGDIDEAFDDITYRKGATVIRMLAEYMGAKQFRTGISNYLKAHKYGNATTNDLWVHLEKNSGKPIKKLMTSWVNQAGFPVIDVTKNKKGYSGCQCRYYRNRNTKNDTHGETWPIPLWDGKQSYLTDNKKNIKINIGNDASHCPAESTMVYINMPPELEIKRLQKLTLGQMEIPEKIGFVRNKTALCEAGYANIKELINLMYAYSNETNHLVLGEVSASWSKIHHVFGINPEIKKKIEDFGQEIFAKAFWDFKWSAKKDDEVLLSSLVLAMAYRSNYIPIIDQALQEFRKNFDNIPAHLRSTTYKIAHHYGNDTDRKKIWEQIKITTAHEERVRLLASITSTTDKKILIKNLDYYMSSNVKVQDTPLLFARALGEADHADTIYQYIKEHFETFNERYGKGGHLLSRILGSLAVLRNKDTFVDMKKFFKANPPQNAKRTLEQVYEKIEANIAWQKADTKILEQALGK